MPWNQAEPIEVDRQVKARQSALVFMGASAFALALGISVGVAALVRCRRSYAGARMDVPLVAIAALVGGSGAAACMPLLRDPVAAARARVADNAVAIVSATQSRTDCNPCPLIEDAAGYMAMPELALRVPDVRQRARKCVDAKLAYIDGGTELSTCCSNVELAKIQEYLGSASARSPQWRQEQLERLSRSPLLEEDAQRARIDAMLKNPGAHTHD